ncbi:unnamed protein product [Rotaria sordida]|uniref:Uncharacterized protein n=1 Tax=Rotaria sordida TaxID=392033 RepID=A0A819GWP0_9BILA|nr:unnamed protein product [Rotaria sordida]
MIDETGSINLSTPPGCSRTIRTKSAINKVKRKLEKGKVSTRKLALDSVIFEEVTVDHARYIEEVFPVALEYGTTTFENDWTFQQDGAKPHVHYLT